MVLTGALVGMAVHDAEHALGDADGSCGVCLNAERVDGAVTDAPSIPATHSAAATVVVRRVADPGPSSIAKEHGPRAPPTTG